MNQEIAESILNFEDNEEADYFQEISESEITGKSRWYVSYSQIFRDIRDGKYWCLNWCSGATEIQDEGPENINFYEVVPKEVTVTKYVRKTKDDSNE